MKAPASSGAFVLTNSNGALGSIRYQPSTLTASWLLFRCGLTDKMDGTDQSHARPLFRKLRRAGVEGALHRPEQMLGKISDVLIASE
jgi:hypothetical protein